MRILITAGPTREFIDPVRFISNSSTGVFGYEIAEAAVKRAHLVTLISGPTNLKSPKRVKFIPVITALDMKRAVEGHYPSSDCLIMCAAVSDYRPVEPLTKKIKKTGRPITIKLKENPDILSEAGKRKYGKILVGFSLETDNLIANARRKLNSKNLDMIIATLIKKGNPPFGDKKIAVVFLERDGRTARHLASKAKISNILLDKVEGLWHNLK